MPKDTNKEYRKPMSRGYQPLTGYKNPIQIKQELDKQLASQQKPKKKQKPKKVAVNPLHEVGRDLEACRREIRKLVENHGRIEELTALTLKEQGFKSGERIPESLPTKLMLEGRSVEGRQVLRLIQSLTDLYRARAEERNLCRKYAQLKSGGRK